MGKLFEIGSAPPPVKRAYDYGPDNLAEGFREVAAKRHEILNRWGLDAGACGGLSVYVQARASRRRP
jgi:hypothetical protein